MRVAVVAFLVIAAAALAGCSDAKPDDGTKTPAAKALPPLHGWVFDNALRPLKGATVKVLDTNSSTTTNDEGYFGFDGLPYEQFLVIVATLDLFIPSSKQITLTEESATRLNFTLERKPIKLAATEVRKWDGFIACQGEASVNDQPYDVNCGTGLGETRNIFQFAVAPDLAGAVIEVVWNPNTPAAESLGAKLETLELGKLNFVIGEVVGASPLRIQMPQEVANKYYIGGGLMRLSVFAQSNGDEVESNVGVSVALQQTFSAFATMCYVLPSHPAYSFVGGSADCQKSA